VPIRKSSVIVVLLMLFTFAGMSAATTYTAANVKGSYSLLATVYGGALSSQSAAVGIFNFDGVSAVTGYATNIDTGSLNVQTISSGTYTVSANGHGSVTASFTNSNGNPPGTWQFAFVLNSVSALVARSLQSILINTGAGDPRVYAITATSINLTTAATAARLKGTYSVLLNWWMTGAQQREAVGTFVFDGKGKVTSSFTYQVAEGTATTVTGTGTYSVNSDGSGSMSLLLSNTATMDFDFVMNTATGTAVAKGIQLLEVDNPSSVMVATGNAVYE
jgi:hypothetical protein